MAGHNSEIDLRALGERLAMAADGFATPTLGVDVFPVDRPIDESYAIWVEAAQILSHTGLDPLDSANSLTMSACLALVRYQWDLAKQGLEASYQAYPDFRE